MHQRDTVGPRATGLVTGRRIIAMKLRYMAEGGARPSEKGAAVDGEPRRRGLLRLAQVRSCRSLPSGGVRRNSEKRTLSPARSGVQHIGPT